MSVVRLIAGVITVLVLLGTAGIALGYWLFIRDIGDDLARLTSAARPTDAVVTEAMLAPLPPAAQRYFRFAGVVGKPIPKLVRLTQTGRIRSSATSEWMNLEAEETYSTSPPAFIWRTWLPTRMLPVALGRDEYLEGKGSIVIKLLGLVPVADEHGDRLAAAGLMRYLNESMWFPSVLLGPNATIEAADANSFRVTLTDRGMSAEARFFVDEDGRLTSFVAPRFNTSTGKVETWETPVGEYRVVNGLNLPVTGSAVWKQATGDFTYIELSVLSIVYD